MTTFSPQDFGPTWTLLIDPQRVNELGPGQPNLAAQAALERLHVDTAFAPHRVTDQHMAACCISAVWLHHDFLDQSHTVSQSVPTASGSFWHGIMHRREGDFSNAKYWFRNVGNHPAFEPLAEAVRHLATEPLGGAAIAALVSKSTWDPYQFVDLCRSAIAGDSSARGTCEKIQQLEWQVLFDYCFRGAVGL